MKELQQEIFSISGGNLAAFNTYVAIFTYPAAILTTVPIYIQFGEQLGEDLFNYIHPDPLGKMVYTEEDFK